MTAVIITDIALTTTFDMAVKDTLEKIIETAGPDIVTSQEFQNGAKAVGAAVVVAATPAIASAGAVVTGAVTAVGTTVAAAGAAVLASPLLPIVAIGAISYGLYKFLDD